jgi:hypothetical protein
LNVKAIAYYLPQFHEIPENNEWWGKGFTEWTNLKKAQPLFDGHEIPKPLNNNYYNLLDKETIVWQTKIAKDHGVYGFNYYHYWFKGKKLLEKPAENFLKWSDINHKFMFMWANHDWTRSWVGGNEILIKQEYGDEKNWIEHINYLMPFFRDDRYIKINNKPVFEIYISENIDNFQDMYTIWSDECKKNGFDGIYIIDHGNFNKYITNNFLDISDAITLQEHSTALEYWKSKRNLISRIKFRLNTILKQIKTKTNLVFYSYDDIVSSSVGLMRELELNSNYFLQVCTGWDNTPRFGSNGYIVVNASPEKFKNYLKSAKTLSEKRYSEYIFIACWNEWCEGLILEPTARDGFDYLEAVKEVMVD